MGKFTSVDSTNDEDLIYLQKYMYILHDRQVFLLLLNIHEYCCPPKVFIPNIEFILNLHDGVLLMPFPWLDSGFQLSYECALNEVAQNTMLRRPHAGFNQSSSLDPENF